MKKIFTLLLCCATLSVSAQYQLQNAGFEDWETISYKAGWSTYSGDEPINWNSFLDGTGSLKNTAGRDQVDKVSNDKRPGSTGSFCAKITARSVLGVIAQGNLTTGCVNMGSMTATDATGNYNYTNISDGKCQTFTGKPDAMRVWVKFSGSNQAKANTILHTAGYYQDPDGNTQEATLIAKAEKMDISSDANNWQELTIPFNYSVLDTRPAYALVSFSTSKTPGSGNKNDYMLIDDLEYIYYSTLSNLRYNNTKIEDLTSEIVGLGSNEVSYTLYDKSFSEDLITFDIDGKGATVEKDYCVWDETNKTYTITVKGDDWSESNKNQHVYKIHFVNNSVLTDVKFNNNTISGFNKETMAYTIDDAYTEGCITYTKDGEKATVEESWDAATKTYTITVKGVDHSDTPDNTFDNKHTYTITFAYDLVIEDGDDIVSLPTMGAAGKILLKRTFKAGWNTLCLPIPTVSTSSLGTGVIAYTLSTTVNDGELSFTSISTLTHNQPYLVYFPNEVSNIIFSKKIRPERTPDTKTAGDWTFTGSYAPSISMEGKWGVINDGSKVRKGGANSTLKSTRAYLEYNGTANVNEMRIIIDGEETSITEIDGMPVGNFDVYNLQGVRVRQNVNSLDGLNKGIYIVNGKKYIVK